MLLRICFTISLIFYGCILLAQNKNPLVIGIVKNRQGGSLIGVNVTLQNSTETLTAQTDSIGIFSFFSVPKKNGPYRLIFSLPGFETQTLDNYLVKIGSLSTIDIKMTPLPGTAPAELDEVVVVGYGKSSKKDVSSSITTLTADDLNQGVITDIETALQGAVAGLNISHDGNPNSTATVILRGPSTLNLGQQPFYVVDDVPEADLRLVSPQDITSVSILKDASAAAIYGNRAANGIILITTRRGQTGDFKLTYNGFEGIQEIANYIPVASAPQLRAYLAANGKALAPTDDQGANTNWQKEISRTGTAQNHNIGFSGGTDKTVYSGSFNYLNNQAIIKGSSLERFAGRFSLEQKALNDRIKFRFSIYNSISNQYDVDTLVFYNVLRFLPTVNVLNPDGTYHEDLTRTQTYNPLGLINDNTFNTKVNSFLGNAGIEAKLPFNITYNLSADYQTLTTDNNIYFNSYSLLAYNENGEAIRNTYQNINKTFENYFSYDKLFNGGSYFKFLLGYSWQQDSNGDGFQSSNINFVSDATSYYNLGLGQAPFGYVPLYGNVSIQVLRLISYYTRFNYNYKNKYLVQGSLRRDGSSAFGINNRWGYFPSLSAAWRVTEEDFMKKDVFNELKLRVGYGVAGNTNGFSPLTPLLLNGSTGSFYYNGQYIKGVGPVQNPNPNLKWEKTAQLDAGIDFGILKNRLTGTIDVYDKVTTNIIYNYQEPASLSYAPGSSIYANAGEIDNKGVELTLNAKPLSGPLQWDVSFNIAHNANNIVSLSNDLYKINYIYTGFPAGTGQSNVSTEILMPGHPVGQFYTLHYLGKNAQGVSMFEDHNGNPTLTPTSADQRFLGNAQPEVTFGFGNKFRYKNFDLSIFMRGVMGNKILNATLATINSPADASNHNIPLFTLHESYNDYNASFYSDRYLENGSYLRLDNATLGYNLKKIGNYIKSVRLYFTGTNLFTITKYTGIDPEINIGSITPGIDNHNYYPKTRSFITGVVLDL